MVFLPYISNYSFNSRYHTKVILEGSHLGGMKFLQIRIHSYASLVVSCVTPFPTSLAVSCVTPLTTSLEDCLLSKLSKE